MIPFKPITLQDADLLNGFFCNYKSRSSDDTLGNALIWRDYFAYEYGIFNNTLVIKGTFEGGYTHFTVPIGNDVGGCLNALRGQFTDISFLTDSVGVQTLKEYFPITSVPAPDWWEYLYEAEDLKMFSGRKYNGQRNHTNFFERNMPNWHFSPVNNDNAADVIAFAGEMLNTKEQTPMLTEENRKISDVLLNPALYHQLSGALYDGDGNVLAFAIGEVKGDTLYVHIEKARAEVRGAYPMIVREFAKYYATDGVRFINREEDMGNEGLRKSKQSYHPCAMIEKYFVKM